VQERKPFDGRRKHRIVRDGAQPQLGAFSGVVDERPLPARRAAWNPPLPAFFDSLVHDLIVAIGTNASPRRKRPHCRQDVGFRRDAVAWTAALVTPEVAGSSPVAPALYV
jgi:hypothetical protein